MIAAQAQSNLSRRVLLERFGTLSEVTILEVSASQSYVKLGWPSGSEAWYPMDEFAYVETLSGSMAVAVKDLKWDEIETLFQKWQFGKTDGPDSAISSDRWMKDGKQGI